MHLEPPKAATILQHSQALGLPYLLTLCSHFLQTFCDFLFCSFYSKMRVTLMQDLRKGTCGMRLLTCSVEIRNGNKYISLLR